jgi:uncharacterized protein YndB with AHSA1/START domain
MHGPDGKDWPNVTLCHEVEPRAKLVYDHGGGDDRPPLFRVTALFTELAPDKTRLEMTMALATPEAAEETRKFIKKAGGDSTWDRLAEYLAEHEGKKHFVINRSFDAPRELMFDLWTKPEHFSQWLPPTGFTMAFIRADIRPGGSTFYSMSGHGMTMYGRAAYLEIRRPDRIVYTQQFCDEHENPARHPKAPTWPATMLTTVALAEEGPDRTRVTVTWEPHGPATPEEIQTFMQARGGMTQGWTGSFDKLDELLANR